MKLTAALMVGVLVGPAVFAADLPTRCTGTKIKAAGKKTFDEAKCHQKAIIAERNVDGLCLGKAESKFVTTFAHAEAAGGCVVTGNATTVEGDVDTCIASFVGAISGAPGCAGAKMKATGKNVDDMTKCHWNAVLRAAEVDQTCLAKAETRFAAAIARADLAEACAGTVATLEAAVESCVTALVQGVSAPGGSTSTTTSSTTTTVPTHCCNIGSSTTPVGCFDQADGDGACPATFPTTGLPTFAGDGVCNGAAGKCDVDDGIGVCCQVAGFGVIVCAETTADFSCADAGNYALTPYAGLACKYVASGRYICQ